LNYIISKHNANVLPLNDPDFAISSPLIPKDEQIIKLKNPYEFGISINFPIHSIDFSFSYFSGYDRIVSFTGANVWSDKKLSPSSIQPDTVLSYRKTNAYGFGLTGFISDVIFRSDFGYFTTDGNVKNKNAIFRDYEFGKQKIIDQCEDNKQQDNTGQFPGTINCEGEPTHKETFLLDNMATYLQSTIELEYSPFSDLTIISQLFNHQLIDIGKADSLSLSTGTTSLDPRKYFIPGLGSPNTFTSENSISIIIQKSFPDIGLDLRFSSIIDLDINLPNKFNLNDLINSNDKSRGSINEIGIEYRVYENTNLLIAINKIFNNDTIDANPFTNLENFSHIRMELKYFY